LVERGQHGLVPPLLTTAVDGQGRNRPGLQAADPPPQRTRVRESPTRTLPSTRTSPQTPQPKDLPSRSVRYPASVPSVSRSDTPVSGLRVVTTHRPTVPVTCTRDSPTSSSPPIHPSSSCSSHPVSSIVMR